MVDTAAPQAAGFTDGPRRCGSGVVRTRRQYNQWVADQTLEDYALRFTAEKSRRWPTWRVANMAMGSIAFLACEAIGASVALTYGFPNTASGMLAAAAVVFVITGVPICILRRPLRGGHGPADARRRLRLPRLDHHLGDLRPFTFLLLAIEASILSSGAGRCCSVCPCGWRTSSARWWSFPSRCWASA